MKYAYALIAPALMLVSGAAAQELPKHAAEPVVIKLDRDVIESADVERRLAHIDRRVRRACAPGGPTLEDRKFAKLCRAQLTADILDEVGDDQLIRLARRSGLIADERS